MVRFLFDFIALERGILREVRRAVYFRLRKMGHQQRWRECLCDAMLEFDAVRAALARETA